MANAPALTWHPTTTKCSSIYISGRRYKFATHHRLSASHARPVPSILASQLLAVHLMDLEMERMLGCQIPAFGVWNYCSDLPITQYFDLAMQQRLLKRGSRRHRHRRCCTGASEEEDRHGSHGERRLVLFSPSPRKPAQIKVIRREVDEQSNVDGGGLLQEVEGGKGVGVVDTAVKRMAASGAVDEDLYKVPRPLIYQKPRKMRKVVWSLWIGCLGLDCIA